jgi:hypothetical protein
MSKKAAEHHRKASAAHHAMKLSPHLAAPAHADIVGDTIHAYRLFPDAGTVLVDLGTFTVPGGGCSECAQNSGIAYNVTGTQITITLPYPNGRDQGRAANLLIV